MSYDLRQKILDTIKSKSHFVKEWDVTIYIKSWTTIDSIIVRKLLASNQELFKKLNNSASDEWTEKESKQYLNLIIKVIIVSCVDENNKPLFNDSDKGTLKSLSNLALVGIFRVCMEHNAILDREELKKNLNETPNSKE